MRIIEQENLLQNVNDMGAYLMERLHELKDKHEVIGDVRGKGLFVGMELVRDRQTKEPVDESVSMRVAADCASQGVLIGRTNRSFREFNNTLALSPALIATKDDLDEVLAALDTAFTGLS